MIPTKIFSAVVFFGAIFLSLTAATSVPGHPIDDDQCYKCPQKIFGNGEFENVVFDFVEEDRSQGSLECYYVNKKVTTQQTFCSYNIDDGLLDTNGNGFCPGEAVEEYGPLACPPS